MTETPSRSFSENARRQFSAEDGLVAQMVQAELDAQPDLFRTAALACAVPHYFNEEILAALLGEALAPARAAVPDQAAAVLEEMRHWDFVRAQGHAAEDRAQFSFRAEAREYLLSRLRHTADFQRYNLRAQAYFTRLMAYSAPLDETAWLRLRPNQVAAMREMLYHLLQTDPAGGYELFRVLFRGAQQWFLPGEAAVLLKFVKGLDPASLPPRYQDELEYFTAVQASADYAPAAAETRLTSLLQRSLDDELRARVLTELGKIYFTTARPQSAIPAFQQSQAIWDRLRRPRESAALSNNMGNVYLSQRDYRQARAYFEKALASLRQVGSLAEQALALNNLGAVYEREEEWGRALEQYQASLEIKRQVGDQFSAARTEVNIGTVYHSQIRDIDNERSAAVLRQNALDRYQRSLQVFRQMGARSEAATVLYKLSLLYFQSGETALARETLPEAIAEFRDLRLPGLENAEKLASRLGLAL